MKKQIILLLLIIGATFSIQAQSKKDLEKPLKEANAKNDSILKENEALKAKTDSAGFINIANDSVVNFVTVEVTKVEPFL